MKLTLTDYDPEYADLSGWYYCEKLDGVRAEWDGGRLWTRTGRAIDAPAAWLARLPEGLAISGELWLGRGRLGEVAGAVNAGRGSPLWSQMRLVAFDLPELALRVVSTYLSHTGAKAGQDYHLSVSARYNCSRPHYCGAPPPAGNPASCPGGQLSLFSQETAGGQGGPR